MDVWRRLGGVLEASWGVLGFLGGVLGRLGSLLGSLGPKNVANMVPSSALKRKFPKSDLFYEGPWVGMINQVKAF